MARKPNAQPPSLTVEDEDETLTSEDNVIVEGEETAEEAAQTTQANGHDADESAASLKEQLDEQRRRADRAEAENETLRQRSAQQGEDLHTTRIAAIDRAIEAATAERGDLRRQIIEAKQAGNYETEVELIDKLTTVNLNLKQLSVGKSALERDAEEAKEVAADPLEAYTRNMKPEARAWVYRHPELVTDREKNKQLERTHYKALGEGLTSGSPEYFEFLDEQLGFNGARREPEPEQPTPAAEIKTRTNTNYSAPPSRTGSTGSTSLPRGVSRMANGAYRLSRELHEAAQISGQTDKEYLDNLLALHREGRIQVN